MSQQFTAKQRGVLRERFVPQENTADFATASQGSKADTALQPGQAATVAQGAKADTALQPGEAATPAQGSKADTALQPGQAVPPGRLVTAGDGLTGGGDLSADRTISLNASSIASLALADTALQTAPILKLSYQTGLTGTSITIPETPTTGSNIILFKNKLMLREGVGEDFTVSGDTITLAVAAVVGNEFDIYYMA